jgi:RNA-directed DNA polymerase
LGIPIVLDRVIQQAIAQVIGPIFDPLFSEHSFGFRPGRSAHDAVKTVQGYIREGYCFARCNDDFIILVKSDRAGQRVMVSVKQFLEKKLKLKINEKKSCVTRTQTCCFLGFTFEGAKIRWSDDFFREFKRRVYELTGRSRFVSMEYRMQKLAEYIRGWMNYFGISSYYRPIPETGHRLRRRIRMCYWKQWRRCRTKVRNLLKLGSLWRLPYRSG